MLVVWRADGKTSVQLEVFVDMRDAARLNAGKDQLRDNLIIRIDGGQDICVSFIDLWSKVNNILHARRSLRVA